MRGGLPQAGLCCPTTQKPALIASGTVPSDRRPVAQHVGGGSRCDREGRTLGQITLGTAPAEPPSLDRGHPLRAPHRMQPGNAAPHTHPTFCARSPTLPAEAPCGKSWCISLGCFCKLQGKYRIPPPRIMGNYTWTMRNNYRRSTVDATVRDNVYSAKPALPLRRRRPAGAAEENNKIAPEIFLCPASAGERSGCDTFSLSGRAGLLPGGVLQDGCLGVEGHCAGGRGPPL